MDLSSKFIKWACSLYGCEGNSDAKIWICGIEWGTEKDNEDHYYKFELPTAISNGNYHSNEWNWERYLGKSGNRNYEKNIAKLYCAITGKNVGDYQTLTQAGPNDNIFKMNLYPIAFHSTQANAWEKYNLDKLTGCKDKEIYKIWCFLKRFPYFANLIKEKHPQLIIGTGISYSIDFFQCFAGDNIEGSINHGEVEHVKNGKSSKRRYYWAKLKTQTTLVVTPFLLGRYGLNEEELIQKIGYRIKQLITPNGREP